MAKNNKKVYQLKKQVILFEQDDFNSQTSEDSEDNWLQDNDLDFGFETSERTVETESELLTLKLLRKAIQEQNPDDQIMQDFGEYVLRHGSKAGNTLRTAVGERRPPVKEI